MAETWDFKKHIAFKPGIEPVFEWISSLSLFCIGYVDLSLDAVWRL